MTKPAYLASLDKLAAQIAVAALEDAKPFHEKLDALKVLTAYHTSVSKGKKPDDTPKDDDFRRALGMNGEEDGPGIRARRGS